MKCVTRVALRLAAPMMLATLPTVGHTQESGARTTITPRFYVAAAVAAASPVAVDPMQVPSFRKRISVSISMVPRRQAIKEIARLSGLEFVYANDVVPAGSPVSLKAEDITVAAALTEILLDASVDVVLGSEGNIILTTRTASSVSGATADTIRGRVTSDSGAAIVGAEVIVTMAPERNSQSATTDTDGRYSIVFPGGSGDYLVHISTLARITFRKRVTRTSGESLFIVNAVLKAATNQLATVTVRATRPKPTRSDPPGDGVGAAEKTTDGVAAAVPPGLAGDLAATASTVPGVSSAGGGISVLGLSAAQNTTTLGGMSFNGSTFPRAAPTSVRVSTTRYDPASGWFSGANTNVELSGGSVFSSLLGYLVVDAPALAYADPVSAKLGQRIANIVADIGGSGPLTKADKYFYSFGVHAAHRSSDAVSMVDADADLLRHAGVAADSVTRALQLLAAARIPVSRSSAPSAMTTSNVSFLARFDRSPFDWRTLTPSKRTVGITAFGSWSQSGPLALGPTVMPTVGGERRQLMGSLGGLYSTYFGSDYLTDLRSTFSYSSTSQTPDLRFPAGSVLVSSTFPDGTGGVTGLQFGGNPTIASALRQWTWETMSVTQFYAPGRAVHRIKLTADARFDGVSQTAASNQLGSFYFNSLADLASNKPAIFTRTLNSPTQEGAEWNAFVALGDIWRVSPRLQLEYGARLEGNVFAGSPEYNPAVERAFGARTSFTPNTWEVLPRLGFTWVVGGASNNGAITFSRMGRFNMGPTSYLRGGIGEFRNMLPAALLSSASTATGLPGGAQGITCIGPAAPPPDWSAYLSDAASAPTGCASSVPNAAFATRAPSLQLFDRGYTAPRSWRGNLSWASYYKRLMYSVEGTYSLNLNQLGLVDLNFRNAPAFTVTDEGRPVFVPPDAISPSSGAVSPVPARMDSAFASVISNRSDLQSVSRQLIVSLSPDLFRVNNWLVSLSYVLSDIRARQGGFDGTTFGSPLAREWTRGPLDIRHTFQVQVGLATGNIALTIFGRLMSGGPFTPIVGSDVNGDGVANDRAFIFDPARAIDPKLASDLRTLVAAAPPNVRTCLQRQFGAPAGANSCEGPWTTLMNATLSFDGPMFHVGNRLSWVRINLTNPLGGLDQLLHGSDALRGWGTQPFPDPVLYYARGFDPSTNRFHYEVNPRFGNTNPSQTTLRAPFQLTLDVRLNLGRNVAEQQLERYLKPGRHGQPGPRLTIAELKRRYERNVGDPYAAILAESDSLLLSPAQASGLEDVRARYRERMDSLWTALAQYLDTLGDTYDVAAAVARQEGAIADARELTRLDVQRHLPTILTPVQLRLLPGSALTYYNAKEPIRPGGRTLWP